MANNGHDQWESVKRGLNREAVPMVAEREVEVVKKDIVERGEEELTGMDVQLVRSSGPGNRL